jgi:hypothetical protein
MRTVVALALALLATSPALARGPRLLRCRDGAQRCDSDRARNGMCVLDLCERPGCGCAPAGCCGAQFCPGSPNPLVHVVLTLDGHRKVQQEVPFGVGTVTVRCRRPPPPPRPSPAPPPY